MTTALYIATTLGPVRIQQITHEDDDVEPVICVNGGTATLPISSAYSDFVKKGSGLIHQDFQHGAFRVDLSDPIHGGLSWQLPLYLAHYLSDLNLFTASSEPADLTLGTVALWSTGEVKKSRLLSPVESIEKKVEQSLALFNHCLDNGVDLFFALPEKNAHEFREALEMLAPDTAKAATLFTFDHLDPLLPALIDALSISDQDLSKGAERAEKMTGATDQQYDHDEVTEVRSNPDQLDLNPIDRTIRTTLQSINPFNKPTRHMLWALNAACIMFILGAIYHYTVPSSDLPSSARPSSHDPIINTENLSGNLSDESHHDRAINVQLKDQNGECTESNRSLRLTAKSNRFQQSHLDSLCRLTFQAPTLSGDLYLVSLESRPKLLKSEKEGNQWIIQLPNSAYLPLNYALILTRSAGQPSAFQTLKTALLRHRIEEIAPLSISDIKGWLTNHQIDAELYQHSLL